MILRAVPLLPLLLAVAFGSPLPAQAPEDAGFRLDLEDQHGGRVVYPLSEERLNADGSAPVVLVVWAGRRGASGRKGWTEALRGRYAAQLDRQALPGLVVLPVAELPKVPGPIRALIRNRYFDDRPPTGLDWGQTVGEQLGFEPDVPNLAVLAPDGTLAARLSGEATEDNRQTLFEALDPLLESLSSPSRSQEPPPASGVPLVQAP